MLEAREWYVVCTSDGNICILPDPAQNAKGEFPNVETAQAAAIANWDTYKTDLYVVSVTRRPVATVSGTTQVVATPV